MSITTISKKVLYVCSLVILLVHFFYYPKWQQSGTEATISWDVSGYYMYLPAIVIYKDLKQCAFKETIIKKYQPSRVGDQTFLHQASGNQVMKYSIGQAIQFLPAFLIAHTWATLSESYEADGFSLPYQLLISLWTLLVAIIGLYFIRKSLRHYFDELPVSLALLTVVFGSNYLNYAAIDGAMTHNGLFTLYAILIWVTIQFYKSPSYAKALLIGAIVGLSALTRPTEIIACIIPVVWGVNCIRVSDITNRMSLILTHWKKYILACTVCLLIGCIQLGYWKYVTGEWLVYSYEDQGFSWLSPHFYEGFWSYKSGWLLYSPAMLFALLGFFSLRKQPKLLSAVGLFSGLFIYITFAWDIWWYGGSLGQRAMVQCYPILLFPMAALMNDLVKRHKVIKVFMAILIGLCCYISLWFTHQAHRGGKLHAGKMNKTYFWKTLGTYKEDKDDLKLLDNEDQLNSAATVFSTVVFQPDTILVQGKTSSDTINVYPLPSECIGFKTGATFYFGQKEWNMWNMTRLTVEYRNQDSIVKQQLVRLQRLISDGENREIWIDSTLPSEEFDEVLVYIDNTSTPLQLYFSDWWIEYYQ